MRFSDDLGVPGSMKTEDGPFKSYLIKTLEPLTEADPRLVADYVIALLTHNKPKKDLQKLCLDSLFDFLHEGTKPFVTKLFKDLDDGTIAVDSSKSQEPGTTMPVTTPANPEPKTSPMVTTKPVASRSSDAEESSDNEDDDRNHKHRRPRSRSFDKDAEDEDKGHRRKRSRSNENGHYHREGYHRRHRGNREQTFASRIVADGAVRGGVLRSGGHSFRGDSGNRFYNQRGRGGWLPQEQRFGGFSDGPDLSSVLLSQGSQVFGNRVPGSLDHVLPGHGFAVNPLVVQLPRQRCPDFDVKGYCMRGDICTFEHGANRIVVDDVQSLSKLTLPIGSSRNGASGSRGGDRRSRDGGAGDPGSEYDPDQPLWGKDARGQQTYQQKQDWKNTPDSKNGPLEEAGKQSEVKGLDSGVSVWDRIGPVEAAVGGGNGKREQGSGNEKPGTDENATSGNGTGGNGNGHGGVAQGERLHVGRSTTEGGSYGGRDRGEKAQRTLYVRCIPSESNKADLLRAHFQKFGEVIDVRVPTHGDRVGDRAFVQFARKEDAETAVVSPEAVFGNRFIKVSWANRDNRGPGSGVKKVTTGVTTGATTASNGNGAAEAAAVAAQNQKKQEELEQMKEEIRKKQEALALKRDEFKRKLEKLSKQQQESVEDEPGKSETPRPAKAPKTTPISRPGTVSTAPAWGPARYKLDNRTTVFKVSAVPSTDVAALRAHFGTFGELSSLEVEEDGSGVVAFSTRRDAERAFTHGRMFQGQVLEPAWIINAATATATATARPQVPAKPSSSADDQVAATT